MSLAQCRYHTACISSLSSFSSSSGKVALRVPAARLVQRTMLLPTAQRVVQGVRRGRRQLRVSASDDCEPTLDEVMTREVVTFTADQSIKDAVRTFVEKRISGAPVVDAEGRLVGVLSESDVLWKESHGPSDNFIVPPIYLGIIDTFIYLRDEKKFANEAEKWLARTVGDAMCKEVVTATPDMALSSAADVMLSKKVNRLPVVDGDGKVVGVMTRSDVLRGMLQGACSLDFGDE